MKEIEPAVGDRVYRSTVRNLFSNTKRIQNNTTHLSPKKHMRYDQNKCLTPFYNPEVRRNWVAMRGETTLNSSMRLRERFLSVQEKMLRTTEHSPD
jgi:hypothetical protein